MTSTPKRPVGHVIYAARLAIRVPQDEFCSNLGVSRRTLSRWEAGDTVPGEFDLKFFVRKIHEYDRPLARRVARELGVAEIPIAREALDQSIIASADALGVARARLRKETGKLVERWRAAGLTLDEVAAALAS